MPTALKQAPKSISIKDALSGKKTVDKPIVDSEELVLEYAAEVDGNDEVGDESQNTFGQDELDEVWQKYIKTFLSDKPRFSSLMHNYLPTLKPDFVIGIEVESTLQVEMFKEIKSEVTLFLRTELENRDINLEVNEVANDNASGKIYTVEDKFKYLSQLNPNIIKFKQLLNLDFD